MIEEALAMWKIFEEQVFTIPQALYNNQMAFGGRPAQLFNDGGKWRIITYNDLVAGCENIAMALMKLGINRHDLLAIKGTSSARWTWADLGNMLPVVPEVYTIAAGLSPSTEASLSFRAGS
jgi:long-subunit acyl-CoA synthetase (AMP-forming)